MSRDKKRMEGHYISVANRIHDLGVCSAETLDQTQQWMTDWSDGTWTIDHEKICNIPCPSTTPEDNRRQLCKRNKEDAGNSTQQILLAAQERACRCLETGDANTEAPCCQVPSASGWCYPAPCCITGWHLHLEHVNLHSAFVGSSLFVLLMEGSPGNIKVG